MEPEEILQAAHGPNHFALTWAQAVGRDDADNVWPHMTRDFRLSRVQDWILHNPRVLEHPSAVGWGRDELAHQLVDGRPADLFPHLARVVLRGMRHSYGDLDVEKIGLGTRPRPIGPDLELVRLLYLPDTTLGEDGIHRWMPGTSARNITVIVDCADGWKVAGISDHIYRPGWPPTAEKVVEPSD